MRGDKEKKKKKIIREIKLFSKSIQWNEKIDFCLLPIAGNRGEKEKKERERKKGRKKDKFVDNHDGALVGKWKMTLAREIKLD